MSFLVWVYTSQDFAQTQQNFALLQDWETVAKMPENWDFGRGPPNITSSGGLETVGSGNLI